MVCEYEIINGEKVEYNQLLFETAKQIINCLQSTKNRLIRILELRKNSRYDIIILEFDLDIPIRPKNGIKGKEIISILVSSNETLPSVYALRNDFPLELPHTNRTKEPRPVSLCIYEETFDELKRDWSEIKFLYDIKDWLEQTAKGKLHKEDQPIEPFYFSDGIIILNDSEKLLESRYVVKLAEGVYKLYSAESFNKDNYALNCQKFLFKYVKSENDILNGSVHLSPSNINFLNRDLKEIGIDLSDEIKKEIDLFLSKDLQVHLNNNLIFVTNIEIKRDEEIEPERRYYFFKINDSILNIGLKSNYLIKSPVENLYVKNNLFEENLSLNNCSDVKVEILNPHSDFSYSFAESLNGNSNEHKFSLIGVGALGSQVLNNFTREGFGKWNIIDNDIVLPHNLTRHQANRYGIGKEKVWFMSEYVNNVVFPNENIVTPYAKNILKNNDELKEPLSKSDYIIDISTSIAVERFLSVYYSDKRKFSTFLNPKGNELVLFSEDIKSEIPLDLIEYQYYKQILISDKFDKHFEFEDEGKVRYARGCRDITSKIPQSNLAIFSGIASKAIKNNINEDLGKLEIWQMSDKFDISKSEYSLDNWQELEDSDWKIFINNNLLTKIYKFRDEKLPNETGGILLGGVDLEYKKIYLVESILAPKDSVEKRTLFIRGIEGVSQELEKVSNRTNYNIEYLGEWHSHPNNCSLSMSSDDNILFNELISEAQHRGKPSIMMIFGNNKYNLIIGNNEF